MLHKIKELCKEKNLTIADLERQAEISPKTIYSWDESEPSVYRAYRVAKILGTTVEELLRAD